MERIWANLNELTQFAIVLISLIAVGFHLRWTRRNTAMGPTFLTTLGIFWALTIKGRLALLGDPALPAAGAQRGATITDLADHLVTLQQCMQESNRQLVQLNVSFERYADKITAANTQVQTTAGLPMIEQSITEMTRQIQQGVTANQAALGSILSSSAESMQSYHQQLTSLLSKTIETANRDLGSHLRRAAEDAGKHVVALDRALEEELTRSIESLVRQLTALSQKFLNMELSQARSVEFAIRTDAETRLTKILEVLR